MEKVARMNSLTCIYNYFTVCRLDNTRIEKMKQKHKYVHTVFPLKYLGEFIYKLFHWNNSHQR